MKKEFTIKYIDIIEDMLNGVMANIKICSGLISDCSITIRLHQVSALSIFLFSIQMDEHTRSIKDGIVWYMLCAYDIVLIEKVRAWVNAKV